mmetsp:Transcript_56371/g.132173  ORF Transcript_56371/g.132173 Transcript_56371/m.132173 type:complete len:673 (-) Transcript_56371:24-2042(-)
MHAMVENQPSLEDGIIHREGHLERRKSSKLYRTAWVCEWFHLSSEFMVAFPSRSSNHVQCCIPLRAVLTAERAHSLQGKKADQCCFSLRFTQHFGHSHCDKTGVILLRAPTAAEADEWIKSIKQGQEIRRQTQHFVPHSLALEHITAATSLAESHKAASYESSDRCAAMEVSTAEQKAEVRRLREELSSKNRELAAKTAQVDDALKKAAELADIQAEYRRSQQELLEARSVAGEVTAWKTSMMQRLQSMEAELVPMVQEPNPDLVQEALRLADEAKKLQEQATAAKDESDRRQGRLPMRLGCARLCFVAWRLQALRFVDHMEAIRLQPLANCLKRLHAASQRSAWHRLCIAASATAAKPMPTSRDAGAHHLVSTLALLPRKALLSALTTWRMKVTFASWQAKATSMTPPLVDVEGDVAKPAQSSQAPKEEVVKTTKGPALPSPNVSSVACASEQPSPKSHTGQGEELFVEEMLPEQRLELASQPDKQRDFREWQEEWRASEQRWWKALAEVVAGSGSETGSSLGSRAGGDVRSQGSARGPWLASSQADSDDGSDVELSFQVEEPSELLAANCVFARRQVAPPPKLAPDDQTSFARCQHILEVMASADSPSQPASECSTTAASTRCSPAPFSEHGDAPEPRAIHPPLPVPTKQSPFNVTTGRALPPPPFMLAQ